MLARPELGTREHILLWLSSQPPEREYHWSDPQECACGTYARETMGKSNLWWAMYACQDGTPFAALNNLAFPHPRTYGVLYERARKAWA